VSKRRCPSCGGLVGADAEWCGQCLTPLGARARPREEEAARQAEASPAQLADETTPRAVTVPQAGGSAVRVEGDQVLWTCPRCDSDNPIKASTCSACGAPFGQLLEEEHRREKVSARRAVRLSLLYPGLGHAALGRGAEGLARAVVFTYVLATVVAILVMRGGSDLGPFVALFGISALAAVVFYALAAIDAGRAANGEPPIVSTRALLYGAAGLILLTVAVLVVTGIRASRG
jgi:hypothetical protein